MIRPLLISRPIDQSEQFAREVAAGCPGRYETVISPLLEIRPEVGSVDTSGAQALLFSSRNAVREFARRSAERNLPALCVGDATAQEAASHGFSAMSANGDVSALAALAVQSYLPDFGHMLFFRGAETAGDLTGALMSEGVPAEERILYDQFPLYLTKEAKSRIHGQEAVAVVFSPRSANILSDEVRGLNTEKLKILAISKNAAVPFANVNLDKIYVSAMPNTQAILKALKTI